MLEFLVENANLNKDDNIAVGVSGGADSMVLLWALIDLQKKVKFKMKVINVNHGLRGEESDRDSLFVKEFCEKKKIPYEIVSVEVKKLKKESKFTLEESARKLRYDAFFKIMKKDRLNKLFLAHHKNDQAETILMNIFRGSGILGASGIREDGVVFRPLLNLKKSEILSIAKEYKIAYVEDSTNYENDATRNYLRNIVIPEIEKVYPNVVDAVFEFGKKCKDVQEFIKKQLNFELIEENKEFVLIKNAVFDGDKILVREYFKFAFEKLGVFSDIESKHYDIVFKIKSAEVNSSFDFPHGLVLKKTHSGIKIFKASKKAQIESEFSFVIGEIQIEGIGKIKTEVVDPQDVSYGDGALYVDEAKISTSAVWRTRRFGDVFSKLGSGSKKLNDYFTDKKIDVDLRDKIPVLAVGNNVLVVAGFDVSEKVKIVGDADRIVKITFMS